MRLLLAEDDDALITGLKPALERAGYAVDLATDGIFAQLCAESLDYDLVLLDLGLPRRSGLEVLQHWRAAHRTMPVVVLTARDSWQEKVSVLNAGADDYVTKPFHTEELLARLAAVLKRSAAIERAPGPLEHGGLKLDEGTQSVTLGDGEATRAEQHRVPPAALLHAERRPGTVAAAAQRTPVRPRDRTRQQRDRSPHHAAAAQDRARLDTDASRPGLRVRRAVRTMSHSLHTRLAAGLAISFVLLASLQWLLAGIAIERLLKDQLSQRLERDAENLLAALQPDAAGQLELDAERMGGEYQRPFSGHYYRIEIGNADTPDVRVITSRSLWDAELTLPAAAPQAEGVKPTRDCRPRTAGSDALGSVRVLCETIAAGTHRCRRRPGAAE
jgi:DNA-binding response OmpR family regulator